MDSAQLPWFTQQFRAHLIAFVRRARPDTPGGEIEDAVHDVLLRIYEKTRSSSPPATPGEWSRYMFRAVSNRLNDLRRVSRRHAPFDETGFAEQPGSVADQPDVSADTVERAALFQCIVELIRSEAAPTGEHPAQVFVDIQRELRNQLKDRQWIVLRLRGLEGLGFQEIATALNASLGSVHGWYRDALEVCAAVLRRHGADGELP